MKQLNRPDKLGREKTMTASKNAKLDSEGYEITTARRLEDTLFRDRYIASHDALLQACEEAMFCLEHCKTDDTMDEEHCKAVAQNCFEAIQQAKG
jgi:hypothetical protein